MPKQMRCARRTPRPGKWRLRCRDCASRLSRRRPLSVTVAGISPIVQMWWVCPCAGWQHPAGGFGNGVLSPARRVSHGGLTQATEPPEIPGRFNLRWCWSSLVCGTSPAPIGGPAGTSQWTGCDNRTWRLNNQLENTASKKCAKDF